ncbi:G-type lectin S-receptor-like serine/threonine-protein kinase At4g03230 isoform X1 [Nicotiana sylvestris]|uniref:non-specific serine/threonine protein kinase n=2 Tax=Nicotiana TaxID=4085 RepID=A0A1S4AAQ4_TOBAC|nr:PREDICTED: G-type lectin S-receptor-like serine/threonine-protein kinase At4g03230 isoform X1 [Nicotiana sylvestris]XP_016473735.1 PREDICTED: G-type lectin S-receptor-like serine/threonine-protein kinase At4g03230 isoform X1 [Nicotiana tabacum]
MLLAQLQLSNFLLLLFTLLIISCHLKCDARNTINGSSKLVDNGETLISAGKKFEMGFYSNDGDEFNKYVGIWYYNLSPRTIVWVANLSNPIPVSRIKNEDISVAVAEDGNLKVWNSSNAHTYFSTEVEISASKRRVELLDTGNLVLVDESGAKLWQSFLNPTDTFLPGMKMDRGLKLTDFRSGNYTFQIDQTNNKKYVILKEGSIHWKGSVNYGPFNFSEMPAYIAYMLSNFTENNIVNSSYANSSFRDSFFECTRLLMNSSGEIQFYSWDKESSRWSLMWLAPKDTCNVFRICGEFGICNSNHGCKCLPGDEPNSPENLRAGESSGGCSRMSVNSCEEDSVDKLDTFLDLRSMKFDRPDRFSTINTSDDCRRRCLRDCKCQAYTYDKSVCGIWLSKLKNLQENYSGGFNLSIRVAASNIEATRKDCKPCGTNLIPYPLSSGSDCGDPLYYSFSCDDLAGQVSFQTLNGNYTVVNFDKRNRTFVIEAAHNQSVGNCDEKEAVTEIFRLNKLSPFKVMNWCYNLKKDLTSEPLSEGKGLILISWKPPLEPVCTTSEDCIDWPDSTCSITEKGDRRCICKPDYKWDGLSLNCTLGSELATQVLSNRKLAPSRNHERALVISISVILGVIILCGTSYIIYLNKRAARSREAREIVLGNPMEYLTRRGSFDEDLITEDDKKRIDVPFFSLNSILVATDNFSNATKLGRGGFGPVYKGKFPEGADMAVKRLSCHSGQGVEEFKTEVMLIAKLQHRNLVRLLGYCVEANEKILLYEYMPNKSLDTFIFDHTFCRLLDWRIRFEIILDIARGLLYLHQDSRLRIIHRDLKTSNILLDEEMNAKISDFGLARIIEGKSTEANTNRVVGTYGYMSPEYALEGLFSIKSDVFAFGVVVLEIISGKRNMEFFEDVNLTGYVWRLWMKDKTLDMMDQTIVETCDDKEVIKCVNVALLCVQEDPGDRPTMSNVVLMLGGESMTLPRPNQPAFITRRNAATTSSSSSKMYATSNKELTITHEEEGR